MEIKNKTNFGRLYVLASPIGNLEDITLRALNVFKKVDIIACEDTRVTRRLLDRYEMKGKLVSFHQHSKLTKIDLLLSNLKDGLNIALVTDAGTPGISDPGGKLVEKAHEEGINVVPIPGPSAITALLSVSGLPVDKFEFLGFVPHKKGRETFFKNISAADKTVVFYESVHRIMKTLNALSEILTEDRIVVIGRELTKQFEEIKKGSVRKILKYYEDNSDKVKGEFVIAVGK
jgi:16S rRNA (cytidine1402-2'-O)-methyltransferase